MRLRASAGERPQLTLRLLSLGARQDAENAVDRLAARCGPADRAVFRQVPHAQAMRELAQCESLSDEQSRLPGRLPGRHPLGALRRGAQTARSHFFRHLVPDAGWRALVRTVESFDAPEGGAAEVLLTALGGAVGRVPVHATAFVHRRERVLAQYLAHLPAPHGGPSEPLGAAGTGRHAAWVRRVWESQRPHASGAAYQNYADPDLDDWRTAYYGPAAARLAEVKRAWDPDRVFDFPQAV
ncbi:BBE domain-containing protein [Streptomyces sp. 549]|nr:BBE domain-containing protein [Streptomyces sp. 549]